jgi:hypothetical protein
MPFNRINQMTKNLTPHLRNLNVSTRTVFQTATYFAERAAKGDIDRALAFLNRPSGTKPVAGDER